MSSVCNWTELFFRFGIQILPQFGINGIQKCRIKEPMSFDIWLDPDCKTVSSGSE